MVVVVFIASRKMLLLDDLDSLLERSSSELECGAFIAVWPAF
jgi:hypothetical protein